MSEGRIRTDVEGGMIPYDFVHPEHQLSEHWPVLEHLHGAVQTAFVDALRSRLQIPVGAAELEVTPRKFREFTDTLSASTLIQEISLPPLAGVVWLCVDTAIIEALVDLYFGGTGELRALEHSRRLTATEQRVHGHLCQAIVMALRGSWLDVAPLQPEVGDAIGVERLKMNREQGVVIDIRHGFTLAEGVAECRIVYPHATLEPIGSRLEQEAPRSRQDEVFHQALRHRVMGCDVELRGVLAEARITMNDLLGMKAGDFIPLSDVETVAFHAHNVPLFDARLGNRQGRVSASFSEWRSPG